ncbi:MAG: DUF6434 domain-containing protein [Polaromonas sp.]|nr:DUF6434 domain-containing protein [Polaromonas sp.]
MAFDCHSDPIGPSTPVGQSYRNTQSVRRFLALACGDDFRFDRGFMAWIRDGQPKTMGQVAGEWLRLHHRAGSSSG